MLAAEIVPFAPLFIVNFEPTGIVAPKSVQEELFLISVTSAPDSSMSRHMLFEMRNLRITISCFCPEP